MQPIHEEADSILTGELSPIRKNTETKDLSTLLDADM